MSTSVEDCVDFRWAAVYITEEIDRWVREARKKFPHARKVLVKEITTYEMVEL